MKPCDTSTAVINVQINTDAATAAASIDASIESHQSSTGVIRACGQSHYKHIKSRFCGKCYFDLAIGRLWYTWNQHHTQPYIWQQANLFDIHFFVVASKCECEYECVWVWQCEYACDAIICCFYNIEFLIRCIHTKCIHITIRQFYFPFITLILCITVCICATINPSIAIYFSLYLCLSSFVLYLFHVITTPYIYLEQNSTEEYIKTNLEKKEKKKQIKMKHTEIIQ